MTAYLHDLTAIAALADQRRDEFEILRYTIELLEDALPDPVLDALVEEVAAPVIAAIDCTQCANCCRHLDVYLTPADANRLAEGLSLPLDEVMARHVDQARAAAQGEWGRINTHPCPFLAGTLCSIYAHRPESCRLYPVFTPDFRWTLEDLLGGAGLCPIIYHVLDALGPVIAAHERPPADDASP